MFLAIRLWRQVIIQSHAAAATISASPNPGSYASLRRSFGNQALDGGEWGASSGERSTGAPTRQAEERVGRTWADIVHPGLGRSRHPSPTSRTAVAGASERSETARDPFAAFFHGASPSISNDASSRALWRLADNTTADAERLSRQNFTTTSAVLNLVLRQLALASTDSTPDVARAELRRVWSDLYGNFLADSRSPAKFARRFGWALRRVPLDHVSTLAQLHASEAFRHLVSTQSFNQMLEFAYRHLGNYKLARDVVVQMLERKIPLDASTYQIVYLGGQRMKGMETADRLVVDTIRNLVDGAATRAGRSFGAPAEDTRPGLHLTSGLEPFEGGRTPTDSRTLSLRLVMQLGERHNPLSLRFRRNAPFFEPAISSFHPPIVHPEATADAIRRFVTSGAWDRARELMDEALSVGIATDEQTGETLRAFNPHWPLKFIQILVDETRFAQRRKPFECPFDFVEEVIARHPEWSIRPKVALWLACLKQSKQPPSYLIGKLERWSEHLGLDVTELGSRTAVRMLQSMSRRLSASLRTTDRPSQAASLSAEADALLRWWKLDKAYGGLRMLEQGPIDGRPIRGIYCFWTSQDTAPLNKALVRARTVLVAYGAAQDEVDEVLRWDADTMRWNANVILEHGRRDVCRVYRWNSERWNAADIHLELQRA